jgi:hypothetical protein
LSPRRRRRSSAFVNGALWGSQSRFSGRSLFGESDRARAADGCDPLVANSLVRAGRRGATASVWQRHSEAQAAARAEAVVARPRPARLDVPIATARQVCRAADSQQSQSRVAWHGPYRADSCDLDHTVVAWPGVAVISSLPAHALLPIVHLSSAVLDAAGAARPVEQERSSRTTAADAVGSPDRARASQCARCSMVRFVRSAGKLEPEIASSCCCEFAVWVPGGVSLCGCHPLGSMRCSE